MHDEYQILGNIAKSQRHLWIEASFDAGLLDLAGK
jgi:hypothetical protein